MNEVNEQNSAEALERLDESLRAITAIADLGLTSLDTDALPDALAGIRRLADDAGRDLQAIESALSVTDAPDLAFRTCRRPGIDQRSSDGVERG